MKLTHGAFYIDASTLDKLHCPRKFQHYAIQKRQFSCAKAGLNFGTAVHVVLAQHYTDPTVINDDYLKQQLDAVTIAEEDYRNLGYLKELYAGYCKEYPAEPFTTLKDANGKTRTELAFAFPLGSVRYKDTLVPIVWTGLVDLPTIWPDDTVWNMDHKTASVAGPSWWKEFECSAAQKGYIWALQQALNRPIDGYIINALMTRKLTRSGKGIEFERQKYFIDQETIADWRTNTLALLAGAFNCYEREMFPMLGPCVSKYGACDYLGVCSMPPSTRNELLNCNLYEDVTWNPLNHANACTKNNPT